MSMVIISESPPTARGLVQIIRTGAMIDASIFGVFLLDDRDIRMKSLLCVPKAIMLIEMMAWGND